MAHQSLYRKYRPQTFSDVVGQQHIERTLRNAVADGTVAHAYLFTGPRGTGKTTTARILAKALNCEKGPTGEPDGTCEQCIEIAEGRHPDVYELDAASRTGVDNVREEIIGRVQFAPTKGKYKVYIIDEVHMLSTAAFNALLKTLEEPPSHVVFVLATTHPHKVPETIQSRCQRFDFHRISIDEIAGRLRVIADGEGFDVPDAALALIGRHAAGGMRDAITTLEQLASFTAGTIRLDDVEGLLGEVDTAQLFEIAGLVARRDVAGCFRWVARFAEEGTDLAEFVRELTGHVRNLYVIAAVGDGRGIVDASAEELGKFESQAAEFGGFDRLARMLDLLGELGGEMRWSSDPRLSLEVALTRMARPQGELSIEALAERIDALEAGAPACAAPGMAPTAAQRTTAAQAPAAPAPAATAPASSARIEKAAPASPAPAPEPSPEPAAPAAATEAEPVVIDVNPAGELDKAAARRAWPGVLAEIKKLKAARAHMFSQVDVDVDADKRTLVLEFPSEQAFSMQMAEEPEAREMLRRALASVFGFAPPTRFQLGRGVVRPEPPDASRSKAAAGVASSASASAEGDVASAAFDDSEPLPEYYETAAGFVEPGIGTHVAPSPERSAAHPRGAGDAAQSDPPAPGSAEPASDIERLLLQDLGAQIVAEHEAAHPGTVEASASDDEEAADSAAYAAAGVAPLELGLLDPEMLDESDREEDQ